MPKRKSKYWSHICSTGVIEVTDDNACGICGKKRGSPATKSKPKRSGKNGNKGTIKEK
jgi:hypothetical protein